VRRPASKSSTTGETSKRSDARSDREYDAMSARGKTAIHFTSNVSAHQARQAIRSLGLAHRSAGRG